MPVGDRRATPDGKRQEDVRVLFVAGGDGLQATPEPP
jgi:hypothetical protein